MGLLQRAIETYDANTALIGVYRDGHEPLAPIGHILTSANIEITLNAQGKFLAARKVDKKEPKILIPVTEESSGRTSGLAAHPLCDQLKYVANTNKEAHELYLTALRKWERSAYAHPFLTAISTYVRNGSILKDLTKCGVLALEKGGGYDEKQMICWRVLGIPTEEPACWKNRNLFFAFESYYCSQLATRDMALCMQEGKTEPIALQHPKGIIPVNGNAKLISANDSSGFTYRGRFLDDGQAATVGYIASQKAHNALRWLASEQGVREFSGKRIFLCWNPAGKTLPRPMRRMRDADAAPLRKPSDYQEQLKSTLLSFRKDHQLQDTDCAVLVSFDAATTGVVSLVLRNIAPRRPLLVGSAETPIPGKLLQGGGQHPFRALVAIFRKHRFKAVLLQVHPVEALTDRLLDGIPAGNIGVVTLAPHGKLISCSGLLCRVGIEIGFVHFTFLPPAFSYHLS